MLQGRDFLKELDFTPAEWRYLLDLSRKLKAERASGNEIQRLKGKSMALIFEKTSTRTRTAFEVAAFEQGAHTTYLDPSGSQIGHKESMADTAQVLANIYAGIEFRGSAHTDVETLAEYAQVPVWNGLTDDWHPTQALCDALTMAEHFAGDPEEISFAYLGDARNNTSNSMLAMAALLGLDLRIIAPKSLQPAAEILALVESVARETGAKLTITEDLAAVEGCDFLHTDVWVSMGEPKEIWLERIGLLAPYAVTAEVMAATGKKDVKFMHCLPAFHDLKTKVGAEVCALVGREYLEVSDEVFSSPASIVFPQAGNRMHTIKAVMVATLAGE